MNSRSTLRFQPLTMTWAEVADVACRRSESWLRDHIHELDGFPRPDPDLQLFAAEAVEAWVRRRFGLAGPQTSAKDTEAVLLGRIEQSKRDRQAGAAVPARGRKGAPGHPPRPRGATGS